MNKSTLIVSTLIIALVASIGFNAYQATQNSTLSNQNTQQTTKLEMASILTQAQVKINNELQALGNSAIYASQQLSTTGLGGEQARQPLEVNSPELFLHN